MGLERDLSILAEHYYDFAVLNYTPGLVTRRNYGMQSMWKHSGNIVKIEDYMINPKPFYLYSSNIRLISPDGINVYIIQDIDPYLITTIDKLQESLIPIRLKTESFCSRFVDRTPLEDISESLIRAREYVIKIGHHSEKFEEYYHKCMNHLEPTMIKSAKARPP